MAQIPDPPVGSWIGIADPDGGWPQLVLRVPLNFTGRWALVLFMTAVLIGAPVCGIILFKQALMQNPPWPIVIFCVLMLVAFERGGRIIVRLLRGLIGGEEPESLTLGENELQYDPGTLDRFAGQSKEAFDFFRFQRRPPVRNLPRGTLAPELRRFDGRQVLRVASDNERIEVGPFLREPDREWLFGVLRAWTGEDGTAKSASALDSPLDSEPARDGPTQLECRREGWEGLRFVLRSPDQDRERAKMVLISGFFLCVWTAFGVGAIYVLLQGQVAIVTLFIMGWLAAWVAGEYFVGRGIASLIRPRESLVLTKEALEHDRGCYHSFYELQDEALWKLGRPQRLSVRRDAIERVRLESIGPRDRLTLDVGADRIEVGRFLTNSDRRRLAEVLEDYVERGLGGARIEGAVMQSVAS